MKNVKQKIYEELCEEVYVRTIEIQFDNVMADKIKSSTRFIVEARLAEVRSRQIWTIKTALI